MTITHSVGWPKIQPAGSCNSETSVGYSEIDATTYYTACGIGGTFRADEVDGMDCSNWVLVLCGTQWRIVSGPHDSIEGAARLAEAWSKGRDVLPLANADQQGEP